jgi:hypothetical protein
MAESVLDVIIRFLKEGRGDEEATSGLKGLADGFQQVTGFSLSSVTAVGAATAAFKFLRDAVGETVEYAMDVKDFGMALGISAEEASKIIQIGDDMRVSQETMSAGFRYALDHGITPNVEGLIALSAELEGIVDPAERMSWAIDKFGRGAAQDMLRFLEAGPDGLREMSDELENSALVMSDDAVQAADEYRLAMDELTDSWEGFKIAVGTGVLEIIQVDEAEQALMGKGQQQQAQLEEHTEVWKLYAEAVREGRITDEERLEVIDKVARGLMTEAEAYSNVFSWATMAYAEEERFVQLYEDMGPALFSVAENMDEVVDAATPLEVAMSGVGGEFDETKLTAMLLDDAIQSVSDSMIEQEKKALALQIAMGNLTEAEIAERNAAIERLENLEELNGLLDAGTISWDDYMAAIADGQVTQTEVNELLGITDGVMEAMIEHQSMIDGTSVEIDSAVTGNGLKDLREADRLLRDIDGEHVSASVYIDVQGGGGGGSLGGGGVSLNLFMARGGVATVPSGFNNEDFMVGLSSGEKLIVIPAGGGERTVNNTLNVYSNSKTEDVVGDFGLIDAWSK